MTLEQVARKVTWWSSPEEALQDRLRFLAQVMVFGELEDILTVRRYFSEDDFRLVLRQPPAGLFDDRSWHYWNLIYGTYPPPPRPSGLGDMECDPL
ncbi:MAG: hypothetical protein EHM61_26580 [Acidobacteria bacterium]|nr:MAG: hypothetical protein EHM61_26580 [Acidobacteriota bacterium]